MSIDVIQTTRRLELAITNLINDVAEDASFVHSNKDLQKSSPNLTGWHEEVLQTLDSWKITSTLTARNPIGVTSDEFKEMLSATQSISQGFDYSFDWSNAARRIGVGKTLVFNLAKQILISISDTEVPPRLIENGKSLEKDWETYKKNSNFLGEFG